MKELDAVTIDHVAGGTWIELRQGWIFVSEIPPPDPCNPMPNQF